MPVDIARLPALLLLLWVAAPGAQMLHPDTLTVDGTSSLTLASQATRVHLLGRLELYTLGLYVDDTAVDRLRLASPNTRKALRIRILHKEIPGERPTIDWRRELLPPLEPAATTHLRGAFTPLRYDDVVVIDYVPGRGTSVHVNKAAAVPEAGHDLMLAFLDHWLGQRPVSEEMKAALLSTQLERR